MTIQSLPLSSILPPRMQPAHGDRPAPASSLAASIERTVCCKTSWSSSSRAQAPLPPHQRRAPVSGSEAAGGARALPGIMPCRWTSAPASPRTMVYASPRWKTSTGESDTPGRSIGVCQADAGGTSSGGTHRPDRPERLHDQAPPGPCGLVRRGERGLGPWRSPWRRPGIHARYP